MSQILLHDERFEVSLAGIVPGLVMDINIASITPLLILPVTLNHQQTLLQSTAIPLGIGASFVSASYLVETYDEIIGTCFADQNGTIFFESSWDNVTFDGEEHTTYIANNRLEFKVPIVARYARITFTNGPVLQTIFRLFMAEKR